MTNNNSKSTASLSRLLPEWLQGFWGTLGLIAGLCLIRRRRRWCLRLGLAWKSRPALIAEPIFFTA
ncbi:MAG: hypothetical protein U0401_02325 [Anaerolineae bacterium]